MDILGIARINLNDPGKALIEMFPNSRPTPKADNRPSGSSEAEGDIDMKSLMKDVAFGCYRPVTPPTVEGEGEGEGEIPAEGEGEGETVEYNDKTVFDFENANPQTYELGEGITPYGKFGTMNIESNGGTGEPTAIESECGNYSLNFYDVTDPEQYFVGGVVKYVGEDGGNYQGVEIMVNTHRTRQNAVRVSLMDDDMGGWLPSMAGVIKAEDFSLAIANQAVVEEGLPVPTSSLTAEHIMFNLKNLSIINEEGVVLDKFRGLSEEDLKSQLDSQFDDYSVMTTAEDGTVTMTPMKDAIYQAIKNQEVNNKVPVRGDKYEFVIPDNITTGEGVKVEGPDEKGNKKVFIPFEKFTKVIYQRGGGNDKLDLNISRDQEATQGIMEMNVQVESTTADVNWIDTTFDNVKLVDKNRPIL